METDITMKQTWLCLARDFRSLRGLMYAQDVESKLISGRMEDFRNHKWPHRFQAPVYVFKQDYQLENFFKRYTFKQDALTDAERADGTFAKFIATQLRIGRGLQPRSSTYKVLQRARGIVKSILGPYDRELHFSKCRFGKRATVGTPFNASYLDVKAHPKYTGTYEEWNLFRTCAQNDAVLTDLIGQCPEKDTFEFHDTLALTLVPKSYKALRCIMPNTDLGAFFTKGLGVYLEERLRAVRLDIRTLQAKHQYLARIASKNLNLVTADLSSASDSFTFELVARLVPRKWLSALNLGRKRWASYNGSRIKLVSFMTMGVGYTFPLQTLLFYALLKSISELTGKRGIISVYGDDLIYPRGMHSIVVPVFRDLGLMLNPEKTFSFVNFRESCGGDYYHGCDVRPFQPEGSSQSLNGLEYAAFCYKLVNGLRARWVEEEIPSTLDFLYKEIIKETGLLLQVPPSFPDYSGVKVDSPVKSGPLSMWAPVSWRGGAPHLTFGCIGINPKYRKVVSQLPYYWQALTGDPKYEPNPLRWDDPPERLTWHKTRPRKYVRGGLSHTRLLKKVAVVVKKGVVRYHRQVGSIHSWI